MDENKHSSEKKKKKHLSTEMESTEMGKKSKFRNFLIDLFLSKIV